MRGTMMTFGILLINAVLLQSCMSGANSSSSKDIVGTSSPVFTVHYNLEMYPNLASSITSAVGGTSKPCFAQGSVNGQPEVLGLFMVPIANPCTPVGLGVPRAKTIIMVQPNYNDCTLHLDNAAGTTIGRLEHDGSSCNYKLVYLCSGDNAKDCTLDLSGANPVVKPTANTNN